MLIRDQQPDADGKIIPSSVREGSASFDTAGRDGNAPDGKKLVTVVISGGLYNVTNATCGMNCTYCNGYNNFVLNPSSLFCLVGCTAQFIVQATDSYGNTQTLTASSWSIDNTAVITGNSGAVQAVGAGQTYIHAYLNGVMVQQGSFCVSDSMTPICATSNVAASATVTVAPALNSISPAMGAIAATTPVTLYGNGFGSGCANVTISAGSAITVSCSSVNSAQIQASFAVSASASGGNQSVSVKVNGQTSPTLNFFVQVPSALQKLSAAVSSKNPGATANGCPANPVTVNGILLGPYGFDLKNRYQVLDQRTPGQPIAATMPLREDLTNFVVDGQSQGQALGQFVTASGNTDADGTFVDDPVGACATGPFTTATFTQRLYTPLSSQVSPTVRTNNFSLSGKAGCGSMTNNADIALNVTCP
jgi:hypothetical protein